MRRLQGLRVGPRGLRDTWVVLDKAVQCYLSRARAGGQGWTLAEHWKQKNRDQTKGNKRKPFIGNRGQQPTLNHLSLNVAWDECVDPDLEPTQLLGEGGRKA